MNGNGKYDHFTSIGCTVCCNPKGNAIHIAREMMFGLRTEFHYSECASCGSLQLLDPPRDLGPYYPQDYYSYSDPKELNGFKGALIKRLRAKRDRSYFGAHSWLGRLLAERYNNAAVRATSRLKVHQNSRILDVGCGSGSLLLRLRDVGFENVMGIDPFISHDIRYANGVCIKKCFLTDVQDKQWDAVMFHHSLEHLPDPGATLDLVNRLLPAAGQCLVRAPVVSWAWKHYRTSWRGVDAPRHIWLPTEKGMSILAGSSGFRLTNVEYDSDEDQFWLSELYSRDHAYVEVGLCESKLRAFFTRRQLAAFRDEAKALNERGCGDTAAFFLEKVSQRARP
jgi:SAM-dependent methyltransferase